MGTFKRRLTLGVACAALFVLLPLGAALAFTDVGGANPYVTAISDLSSRGVIDGYLDGSFKPDSPVLRQQFAKMLVLVMGLTPTEYDTCSFADVEHIPGDLYPFHYVALAASRGLTTGYPDGTFRPANKITRQQVITMAVRAAGSRLEDPPEGFVGLFSYADPTHGENIRKAEFNSLLEGLQGPLAYWDATQYATRGECAQILWNLTDYLVPLVTGAVTRVVDGDTIHVDVAGADTTVRLIGIDTPETGEPFAAEATAELTGLVGGKTVRLEYGVTHTDQYGRTLAYVWFTDGDVWEMANETMLLVGLATLYTVPPNIKYTESFQNDQALAEQQSAGMWGATGTCPLEIVSVNYDAPGNDNFNLNEEYVTFRALVSGSLVGYAIEDATGHRYDFPDRIFQKGQVFKLHTGEGTNTQTDLYWGATGAAIWNNNGDTVKVLDPEGEILLSYSY